MAKLYNMIAMAAVATMLAGAGFSAYLFGSGRLNAARLDTMAAVMRGEYDDEDPAPDEQTAATDAELEDHESPEQPRAGRSADEIRRAQQQDRQRRAALERAAEDALARQRLAEQALQHLMTVQEEFEQAKQAWSLERDKLHDDALDKGFQREIDIVSKLPPKQAKEHLLLTWHKHKADAVRLFMKLSTTTGRAILEQCKSPEEIQVMHELLEQIRLQDIDTYVPASGKTEGDTSP